MPLTRKQQEEVEQRIAGMREHGMNENADRLQRALEDALRAEDPEAVANAVREWRSLKGIEKAQFFSENREALNAAAFRFKNDPLVRAALEE